LPFLEIGLDAKEPNPPRRGSGGIARTDFFTTVLHQEIVTHLVRFPKDHSAGLRLS
jgi:hypothetical protein